MRDNAAQQLRELESGNTLIPKELPDGELVDGTPEQMALLRATIDELDEVIGQSTKN